VVDTPRGSRSPPSGWGGSQSGSGSVGGGGSHPYLDGGAALRDGEAEHDEGLGHPEGLAAGLGVGEAHAVQVVGLGGETPRHHQDEVPVQEALHGGCDNQAATPPSPSASARGRGPPTLGTQGGGRRGVAGTPPHLSILPVLA